MQQAFDPYRDWLGVSANECPPDHYQLLGLRPLESDPQQIEQGEMLTLAKVLRHETGPHADIARRLVQEIGEAFATLADPVRKASYDAERGCAAGSQGAANCYRLLDLPDFESNLERIETAHMIQVAKVLREERGADAEGALKRHAALDEALATLTNPVRKSAHDAMLRAPLNAPSEAAEGAASLALPQVASRDVLDVPSDPTTASATSMDLTIPDEEEDWDALPAGGSAAAIPVAAERPGDWSVDSSQAAADDADVGLLSPPPAKKPSPRISPHAKLPRSALLGQKKLEAPRPARKLQLPSIPLTEIAKLAGGVAIVAATIWGGMNLLASGPPTGQPSGRILLNGQPIAGAEMRFVPADDPDQLFIGVSGADGLYQVSYRTFSGLPVGRYSVAVTRYELPGGKALNPDEENDALKSDAKAVTYAFEQEIARGGNAIDFELAQAKKSPGRK
jgi:curved DNA-binding protein CbpA